jgi:hypothetical protein
MVSVTLPSPLPRHTPSPAAGVVAPAGSGIHGSGVPGRFGSTAGPIGVRRRTRNIMIHVALRRHAGFPGGCRPDVTLHWPLTL